MERTEVETQTASETYQGGLIIVVFACEFETYDFLRLDFVFHQDPVHDSSIGGNAVEVEFLTNVGVPQNLPDGVRVFLCPDRALINGPFVFVANIENENRPVVQAHGQKGGTARMEIQAHHPGFGVESIFRPVRVLYAKNANQPHFLSHKLVRSQTHCE